MLPKVKSALHPDDNKPYYHSAIVVDRIMEREKSDGAVTVTMTSATKEVKLHDSDYYCPPYRVGIRGIFGGVRMLAVQFIPRADLSTMRNKPTSNPSKPAVSIVHFHTLYRYCQWNGRSCL